MRVLPCINMMVYTSKVEGAPHASILLRMGGGLLRAFIASVRVLSKRGRTSVCQMR